MPENKSLRLPFEPAFIPNDFKGNDLYNGNGELLGRTAESTKFAGMYGAMTVESSGNAFIGMFPSEGEALYELLVALAS